MKRFYNSLLHKINQLTKLKKTNEIKIEENKNYQNILSLDASYLAHFQNCC